MTGIMESTPRETPPPPRNSATTNLILYDENEARGKLLYKSLLSQIPGIQVHRVRTREEAERVLQVGVTDLILVSCAEGEGMPQAERVRAWAQDVPVITYEASAQVDHATAFIVMAVEGNSPFSLSHLILDVMKQRPSAPAANGMHTSSTESLDYQQVRSALLRANHDINNPLSIISGNAQLLLELARATGLDDGIIQPMRDIEEASRRASSLLRQLVDLAAQLEPPVPNAPR